MSPPANLKLIAITGGIGSGKSTVAGLFAESGVPVIDADLIAHSVTEPGGRAIAPLVGAFGDSVLDLSGAMDRRRMRERAFADGACKAKLEAILHPLIREEIERAILANEGAAAGYALLAIPLLFETMSYRRRTQRVLVVDCAVAQQRQRVQLRSGLPALQIDQIIASQVSRATRLQLADDVICNSGAAEMLLPQVLILHKRYQKLRKLVDE